MLRRFKSFLDRFLETLVAASMAVLVVDVTWQVTTRFIIKNPSSWTEELATYLMIWVGLLGAAVALNRRAHLGIDYFVLRWPPKTAAVVEAIVYLLVFLFSASVLVGGGLRLVLITFRFGQLTPALKLPMWVVYLAVPTAGIFLSIYTLDLMVAACRKVRRLLPHHGETTFESSLRT